MGPEGLPDDAVNCLYQIIAFVIGGDDYTNMVVFGLHCGLRSDWSLAGSLNAVEEGLPDSRAG